MIVRIAAVFLSFLLISAHAEAQSRPAGPPSATIRIKQLQVAFIGSGAIGGGTLRFRNNSYDLTVGGFGIGDRAAAREQMFSAATLDCCN